MTNLIKRNRHLLFPNAAIKAIFSQDIDQEISIDGADTTTARDEKLKTSWEALREHPKYTAQVFTASFRGLLLQQIDPTNVNDSKSLFEHLEVAAAEDREQLLADVIIFEKLKAILKRDQTVANLFRKFCPKTVGTLARPNEQGQCKLLQLAAESNHLAIALLVKPIKEPSYSAGQPALTATQLAEIFAQQDTKEHLITFLLYFLKYYPNELKALFEQIASEQATGGVRAGLTAEEKLGHERLHSYFFATDDFKHALSREPNSSLAKLNAECIRKLLNRTGVFKALFTDTADVACNANLIPLLTLNGSSAAAQAKFAMQLASKGKLDVQMIAQLAPHIAVTFPARFKQWWRKLGQRAHDYLKLLREKLSDNKKAEVNDTKILETAFAADKVRVQMQTEKKLTDNNLIVLLDEPIAPELAQGLASDKKLWPLIQVHFINERATSEDVLRKSIYFFAQMQQIDLSDLILTTPYAERTLRKSKLKEAAYNQACELFHNTVQPENLFESIKQNAPLIEQILRRASAQQLFSWFNSSNVINAAVIKYGYLEKIATEFSKPVFNYSDFLTEFLNSNTSLLQCNYVIEFCRPHLTMEQKYSLAERYPASREIFYAPTQHHQKYFIANGTAIDLSFNLDVKTYVKAIILKLDRKQQAAALLKAVILMFNNFEVNYVSRNYRDSFLNFKLGFFSKTVRGRVRKYVNDLITAIAGQMLKDSNFKVDLETKFLIENLLQNPELLKVLALPDVSLHNLLKIKNLNHVCYRTIANSDDLFLAVNRAAKKSVESDKAIKLEDLSPYMFLGLNLSAEVKAQLSAQNKLQLLVCLLFNQYKLLDFDLIDEAEFNFLKDKISYHFRPKELNILIEQDVEFRTMIFAIIKDKQLSAEQRNNMLSVIKCYSAIISFAKQELEFFREDMISDSVSNKAQTSLLEAYDAALDYQIHVFSESKVETRLVNNDLTHSVSSTSEPHQLINRPASQVESIVSSNTENLESDAKAKINIESGKDFPNIEIHTFSTRTSERVKISTPDAQGHVINTVDQSSSADTGEATDAAAPMLPPPPPPPLPVAVVSKSNTKENLRLKNLFNTIFSIAADKAELKKCDDFVAKFFKFYHAGSMAEFNKAFVPTLGKIVEKNEESPLLAKEAAWNIFLDDVNFEELPRVEDQSLEDRINQFKDNDFPKIYEVICRGIKFKHAQVFYQALSDKKITNALIEQSFGYELNNTKRESLAAEYALKKWPFDREKFDTDIAPWLGFLILQLQRDDALSPQQAFTWFMQHVAPDSIIVQGYAKEFSAEAFFDAQFVDIFEKLKNGSIKLKALADKKLADKVKAASFSPSQIHNVRLRPATTPERPALEKRSQSQVNFLTSSKTFQNVRKANNASQEADDNTFDDQFSDKPENSQLLGSDNKNIEPKSEPADKLTVVSQEQESIAAKQASQQASSKLVANNSPGKPSFFKRAVSEKNMKPNLALSEAPKFNLTELSSAEANSLQKSTAQQSPQKAVRLRKANSTLNLSLSAKNNAKQEEPSKFSPLKPTPGGIDLTK